MALIVGGLGGGGDVGLAAILVEYLGLEESVSAIASFARCSPDSAGTLGKSVAGALVEIKRSSSLGRRFFEDKLLRVAWWARKAYVICTRSPWDEIAGALEWLLEEYNPESMLHTDLGGDGLLLGYERGLGSYKTDAIARAALAWASREYGVKSLIAVGGVGSEGGGGELDPVDIASTLEYLGSNNAILAALVPSKESLAVAKRLLGLAESGMLPLYIHAVEGRSVARIDMAYLHGEYKIKPWYRYTLVLDTILHCNLSPLCSAAIGKGIEGITRWQRPKPPVNLERTINNLRHTLRKEGEKAIEEAILNIIERYTTSKEHIYKLMGTQ